MQALRPGQVLSSKDFTHFRKVDSPVAMIAHRFHQFLASDHPAATECRFAYSTAFLGYELPSLGDYLQNEELDHNIKAAFRKAPTLVLAQGPMKPYGLFAKIDGDGNSIHSSERSVVTSFSNSSIGFSVDPYDAIFLPWTAHQNIKNAIEAGEEQEKEFASYFAFACIVHETAHWLALSQHGYVHDKERDIQHAHKLKCDRTMGTVTIHSRNDFGTHAKEMVLGRAFQFISYADGSSEVVTQRILPLNPRLKPCLPSDVQTKILDCNIPFMQDITQYGSPNVRQVPRWRNDGFLIVTSISPDAACHHGACRNRLTKH